MLVIGAVVGILKYRDLRSQGATVPGSIDSRFAASAIPREHEEAPADLRLLETPEHPNSRVEPVADVSENVAIELTVN